MVPPQGYFARRAQWGGPFFTRPTALIGPDKAQAIWVNASLPMAVHRSRRERDAAAEGKWHEAYTRLPLREPVGPARLMAHRLLGSERTRTFILKREWAQQALLQIFQDFCHTTPWACRLCVFPKVLDLAMEELG